LQAAAYCAVQISDAFQKPSLMIVSLTFTRWPPFVDRFDTTRVVAEPGCSPRYVLRGLDRLVELELDRRRLADWNPRERRWLVEGGEYRLHVGRSSRDLRLSTTIHAAGGPP
jgi:hypothetical protein